MKIGMVGCGKLGLMVALTIESKGHEVKGYDIAIGPKQYLASRTIPFQEENVSHLLSQTKMEMVDLKELCEWADILFLAPQTPHSEQYEGIMPLPETRADFNYFTLTACVMDVCRCLYQTKPTPCVILSTVLPGTLERDIIPHVYEPNFRLVYSPQFIAMGTVYHDFLNPEFWLIGAYDEEAADKVSEFYRTIADALEIRTDIRTAEGIKVLYNTFVTTKTVLANLYGELSHRMGMNVDDIYKALCLSTRRLLSPKYLRAGMGDGGGCHPRDNIALSWLARECGLSFDFFEALMTAREKHCEFLADLIEEHRGDLFISLLGLSFKPETNIKTGSPALLLSNILLNRGIAHDRGEEPTDAVRLWFIGCQHERYKRFRFAPGSVIIDPFRYIEPQEGVSIISVGNDQTRDHRTSAAVCRA